MNKKNREDGIGVVASGSKPSKLKFYANNQICNNCVAIENQDGRILYEITEVGAYNSRMEDIEFVRHILPEENYSKYNVYIVSATLLGRIKNGTVYPVEKWFVAPPGEMVVAATKDDIALVYGVEEGELKQKIGKMIGHEQISVWLNFPQLLTTHMAIVGRSGHGKSNMVKVLLKKFPMKYVLFTKVNEYSNIMNSELENLDNAILKWNPDTIKKILALNNTEMQNLKECIRFHKFHGKIHSAELSVLLQQNFSDKETFKQVSLFENNVQTMETLPKYVESLCKKLEDWSIVIDFDKEMWNESSSKIVNMQGLTEKQEEVTVFSYLFSLLSSRRKYYQDYESNLPIEDRIVIFIEEAHNYVPSIKTSICKDVIRQIAREGRKLGIHLVFLSQRPRHIDPTALSQCGSIVSFNLTNPEDIDYIMANANFYGEHYKNTIRDLQIGECMIVSDFLPKGINCKVDLNKN